MDHRRHFLKALAAAAVPALPDKPIVRNVATQALPAPFDGWTARFVEVTTGPKGSSPHTHEGFVLGYVVDGEFQFQIAGHPEQTLKAGQTFYEPPGAQHTVSKSARQDRPAKILAIIISKP